MAKSLSGIKLVIYKKIVEGDLRKFTATSNDTPSGGGARDLRFSPASEFFDVFQRMFSPFDETDVLRGYFYWEDHSPTEVFVHPPTQSRPNEVRISRIHECFPAYVVPKNARDCILLLILDDCEKTWPYFTSRYSLLHDTWHPDVKQLILEGLDATRPDKITAMGYVDIERGGKFTNAK